MPNENETIKKPEDLTPPPAPEVKPSDADRIIQEAKQARSGFVKKEEYDNAIKERDAAIADRDKVYKAVLEGEEVEIHQGEKKSIAELRQRFHEVVNNRDASNLEITTAQIELRDAIIENGGQDPFLANADATEAEIEAAQRVADVKRLCVKEAKGDPKKFNYLWEQHIKDDDPATIAALKKRSLKSKK